ncbi:MAG: hypothetical protein Q8K65_00590 [Alphaproteobacteria bacterium]|nr:hypothetical protein [Alphaproteobacteria bacterium]
MSNKDEFELDVEDASEESFDDVSLDEEVESLEEAAPKKKKSGGGLMVFVVLLAVLGGGSFAAVKFLGVQLPFDIPGMTQTAQVPAADETTDTMTASADLPAGELPPQPAVPADETTADAGNLPFGIPEVAAPDDGASVNAPWGMEETPATAAQDLKQPPVESFGDEPAAQADSGDIVDPFAMGAQQDVTEAVNAPDAAAAAIRAPAESDVVDPFATAPSTDVPSTDVTAASKISAPVEDAAAKARVEALEKKLATTEKSLADAEKALKQANDELAKKSAALAQAQADLKTAQSDAKAAAKTATVSTKQPAENAVKATADKPAPAKPAAPARKIDWVLRSAKPGMAWISEKGSTEMRTVSVGDTLAGIGKVTSIATDAQGRWIVNGTRGSINQ